MGGTGQGAGQGLYRPRADDFQSEAKFAARVSRADDRAEQNG